MDIKEINKSLTTEQRVAVANAVAIRGRVGIASVYRWLNGEAKPLHLYRELIQDILRGVTGSKVKITWN